jgi:DNA-binding MurR/RpiR family transcriptional regulator
MKMLSSFSELVETKSSTLSRTEHRVARFFAENRHQVLVQSALELAQSIGTSDATIIRTARSLGFDGLDSLRKAVAAELEFGPTPAGRMSKTLDESSGSLRLALETTLAAHADAASKLRDTILLEDFQAIVHVLADARDVAVFGLGPSSSIAEYFCIQLRRLGFPSRALTKSGFLLADDLLPLKSGSAVVMMAYGRVYPELSVLLAHAKGVGAHTILVTDRLQDALKDRVERIVTIPRGRPDAFSMHSATVAFLETLLVGLGTASPQATVESLNQLNRLRADLAGQAMKLAIPDIATGYDDENNH